MRLGEAESFGILDGLLGHDHGVNSRGGWGSGNRARKVER